MKFEDRETEKIEKLYRKAVEEETPELWDKIEEKVNRYENNQRQPAAKFQSRRQHNRWTVYAGFAAVLVLVIAISIIWKVSLGTGKQLSASMGKGETSEEAKSVQENEDRDMENSTADKVEETVSENIEGTIEPDGEEGYYLSITKTEGKTELKVGDRIFVQCPLEEVSKIQKDYSGLYGMELYKNNDSYMIKKIKIIP